MDYKDYSVEDFLQNEFFVDWVLRPNSESHHFWVNWLNGHPEKRGEVEMARELIKSLNYQQSHSLDSNLYADMLENILQHKKPALFSSYYHLLNRSWFRAAASLVMVFSCVVGIYYATQGTAADAEQEEVRWIESSTEYGQKRSISLPDGTHVMLNAGSKIEYPEIFDEHSRIVRFSGEGFFEVAHDPEKPFLIKSGALCTRVLGTSFNIKSFEEEDEASVSVVTGKVEIATSAGQATLLMPNDMGVFHKRDKRIVRKKFDSAKLLAWTQGELIFENEDLPTIFSRLEKWYGVKFKVEAGVNLNGRYSGEYKKKSLELVLEGLSYTSNFNYQINHKTIRIYEENLTEK